MKKVEHDRESNPFNGMPGGTVPGQIPGMEDLFKGTNPTQPTNPQDTSNEGGGLIFENYEPQAPQAPPGPEGLFDDLKDFSQPQQPQQPQQPPTQGQGQDYGGQEQYQDYGGNGNGSAILKFAGVIALVLLLGIGWKVVTKTSRSRKATIEAFVKANPSGGVDYGTSNTDYSEYDAEGNYLGEILPSDISTEIVKYKKMVGDDKRTMIAIESETHGNFDIHIPYYRYQELETKGYLLVDIEVVNSVPTFIYISNKNENLTDILNK